MKYKLLYHHLVVKSDIPSINHSDRLRLKSILESKLVISPELFSQPLRHSFKNYRKLRAGPYRVIFRLEKNVIKIIAIQSRSKVYKNIFKRIS